MFFLLVSKERTYRASYILISITYRYESQFIQEIAEAIGNKLDYITNRRLRVDPYVIGRGYYVESLNMWLEDGSNDVGVAVIHIMGGIGKTTISKIAYNQNFNKFQASSFLSDIQKRKMEKISKRGNFQTSQWFCSLAKEPSFRYPKEENGKKIQP